MSVFKGLLFWKKKDISTGNDYHISHSKGLTKEQAEWFHGVKEGDRFILFVNSNGITETDYSIRLVKKGDKINSSDTI